MAIDIYFDYRQHRGSFHISMRGHEFDHKYNINREDSPEDVMSQLSYAIETTCNLLQKDFKKRKFNFKIEPTDISETVSGYSYTDYKALITDAIKKYELKGKIMELK